MANSLHIGHHRSQLWAEQLALFNLRRQRGIVKPPAVFAPVAKSGMFYNGNRFIDDLDLLNHTPGVWHKFKDTAAIRTRIKRVGLVMIDLVWRQRRPLMFGMSGLAADLALSIAFGFSGRLDNIRRGGLGRVGGILRELSDLICEVGHLLGKFGVDFKQFSDLFFKFCDTLNVKLFCFGSHISSLKHRSQILSDECGVLLEKSMEMPP